MKAIDIISFLGQSVSETSFFTFLESHNFDTKKFSKLGQRQNKKLKRIEAISKLHGIELRFTIENEILELNVIVFSKPQSDGLQAVYEIEYPFGLHLNQKKEDYEIILGDFVGFDEPQSREFHYKNYAITRFFEPKDTDKKIKSFGIFVKNHLK